MKSHYWNITYIWIAEFPKRKFPLVFLAGSPSFIINQWIFYLFQNHITQSLLEERLRGVLHLAEFTHSTYGERELVDLESNKLLYDFVNAKKYGTIDSTGFDPLGLYWRPLPTKTIKRYISAINSFDKWQATFHNSKRINPSEKRFMSSFEKYSKFKSRIKWDPLLHLFPAKNHIKEIYNVEVRQDHARFYINGKKFSKCFPLDKFVELVESSPNPRDKMIWLLLFGLGLRQSEALHLFYNDYCGIDITGEAIIRLGDPEIGIYHWYNEGKLKVGTRAEYLSLNYRNTEFKETIPILHNLMPRTRYGGRGSMQVGFKGMTFHTNEDRNIDAKSKFGNLANWIDSRIGIYFTKCFKEYSQSYFYGKSYNWPYHPFLFININKDDFGLPLSIPAIKKAWQRALKKINLEDTQLGLHSLRHLTGYYCASVLKLPLEVTSTMLRHASSLSTTTYYHLLNSEVENMIRDAINNNYGLKLKDYFVFPESPKLNIPDHWYLD